MRFFPRLYFFAGLVILILFLYKINKPQILSNHLITDNQGETPNSALNIEYMRKQEYPASEIKIEETLSPGSNYQRYIVSYIVTTSNKTERLKEFAYMTVPITQKPINGFPVIIFNHGYQIPKLYTPEGNYIAYMDALAKNGYVILKPDYQGNGKSDGSPGSTYFSPNYHVDVLSAVNSIKKYKNINPDKIGIWGHSMGGNIALRVSEISQDIKAVVIWAGVLGSYQDIIYNWQDKVSYKPETLDLYLRNLGLAQILAIYGTPIQNPTFWNSIDPTENLKFIKAPFQIHVGLADNQVPPSFSKTFSDKMKVQGKQIDYYEYQGANHDINQSFDLAMKRTIQFFDSYLK